MPSTDDYLTELEQAGALGAQSANGMGAVNSANAQTQAAYNAIIQNLKDRFGDYQNLPAPNYKNLTAQTLGPSALSSIPQDAQARTSEQQAISQLGDVANRGGLDLSDMAALDSIQQNLNRNSTARQQAVTNQFASRGELGSGAQLSAALSGAQNQDQNANSAGQSAAGQAQQRAMQAIMQKAQAARTMGQDDYAKQAAAAQATDAINKYNAGAMTDVGKYNNTLQGQGYADQLAKLQGEGGVTGQLNTALLGSGQQNANATLANGQIGNNLISGGAGILGGLTKGLGGASNSGANGGYSDAGTAADAAGTRGGPSDLTGGQSDTTDATAGAVTSAAADDGFEDYPY